QNCSRSRRANSWPAQDPMRLCQPRVSVLVLAAVCCGVVIAMPPSNDSTQFVTGNGDRAEPVEIWKARKLIRDHSDGELSLTEIAKSVHLSANYLSEKFKEVTGVTFVRYVGQTRTAKAPELLRNSNLRISEIAFAVGLTHFRSRRKLLEIVSMPDTATVNDNKNKQLVDMLRRSRLFRDYENVFTKATGLPLALRPLEYWQLEHHQKTNENPFCALLAQRSKT